jgi:hypothetical protein
MTTTAHPASTALTPASDKDADNAILQALPVRLRAPFVYVLEKSISVPELAAFPTFYISALLGNEQALKRVLETVFAVHGAAQYIKTREQLGICNTVVWLGNAIASMSAKDELPLKVETASLAATASPTTPATKQVQKPNPPVRKADRKPKPAIDPEIKFVKPGSLATNRTEKN